MSEIGPVVAERWDHDAAERGEGPTRLALRVSLVRTRLALRVSLVRYAGMDTFLAELDPDAEIVSITPVDAATAQVVWRAPCEAPKPLVWISDGGADGNDWRAESQGVTLIVFQTWQGTWQWQINPGGPQEWIGSADYATHEVAQQRAEACLPGWLGRYGARSDDGFAALTGAETSPGRWVGKSGNGGTLTVMPSSAIPGAWCWASHGRLFMVGYGFAGSEDEAKRRSWRAWREFEDAQGVGSGGK